MFEFHTEVRKVFPNRLFGFGYMGAYDFLKAGYTQEEFENFPADIAKMGVVWQVSGNASAFLGCRVAHHVLGSTRVEHPRSFPPRHAIRFAT
jgi:isocitrate lyase